MQLHLIRGLLDSPSIIQYADRVAEGLRKFRPDIEIREVQPPSPSGARIGRIGRGLATQAVRYGWYPLRARRITEGINHITDHLHAHLLEHLDPAATVVTCHDLTTFVHPENITSTSLFPSITAKFFHYAIDRLHKAACVVAVSENTKKDILTYSRCRAEQIRVVYHGIDAAFSPNADHGRVIAFRKQHAVDGARLILHVGLNTPYKNVESVFRVVRGLVDAGHHVRLIKAGASFTAGQLNLIDELRLGDRIVHLGSISRPDLVTCYQASDLLLFPSIYEGFGWPPVEAMACGTPVVASAAGSIPEIAGDAAILENPTDVGALVRAVAGILSNEGLRQRLIASGIHRASLFTWQRSISQLAAVYEDVARLATPRS